MRYLEVKPESKTGKVGQFLRFVFGHRPLMDGYDRTDRLLMIVTKEVAGYVYPDTSLSLHHC